MFSNEDNTHATKFTLLRYTCQCQYIHCPLAITAVFPEHFYYPKKKTSPLLAVTPPPAPHGWNLPIDSPTPEVYVLFKCSFFPIQIYMYLCICIFLSLCFPSCVRPHASQLLSPEMTSICSPFQRAPANTRVDRHSSVLSFP